MLIHGKSLKDNPLAFQNDLSFTSAFTFSAKNKLTKDNFMSDLILNVFLCSQ